MALGCLRWIVLWTSAGVALAQTVKVYSEFQRIDPFGSVVAVDKAVRPREILSPAALRNALASFHLAVNVPAGVQYSLFVGQNPDRTAVPAFYKELYTRLGAAWIPDRLEKLSISEQGLVAEAARQVPGQTTVAYWLDLWIPPDAKTGRVRFEVQLNIGEEWVIYPLEVRVLTPVLAGPADPSGALAPIQASAAASAASVLRGYVCGAGKPEAEGPLTIRRLIRRNARQDLRLVRGLEPKLGKDVLIAEMLQSLILQTQIQAWCQSPVFPPDLGAEWYLRVRDRLYRAADLAASGSDPEVKITITPVKPQP
jgi:hypothetical protein